MSADSEWCEIEAIAAKAAAGDACAWRRLLEQLEPELQALVRYQRIGRLRHREDDLRDIVVALFEKLGKDDKKTLKSYFSRAERPRFSNWIRRVLHSCAIDHLRAHPEYRRDIDSSRGRWVSLATLSGRAGAVELDSLAEKRATVIAELRRARALVVTGDIDELARKWKVNKQHVRRIARKGEYYEPLLGGIFAGKSYPEIAEELGLTRREVELMARYIEEFLYERFRTKS